MYELLRDKSISVPIVYVVALFGSVSWLTTTYNTVENNRANLIEVESEIKDLSLESKKLKELIIKIDGKIDTALKLLELHRKNN